MQVKKHRALALFSVLALAACSGDAGQAGAKGDKGDKGDAGTAGATGATGATGAAGTDGKDLTAVAQPESCEICHKESGGEHQDVYKLYTNGLSAPNFNINTVSLVSTENPVGSGKYDVVLTFKLTKNGAAWTGLGNLGTLKTKTVYFNPYAADAQRATKGTFPDTGISFGAFAETPANSGTYTAAPYDSTAKATYQLSYKPEASVGVLYMALGDSAIMPSPAGKRLQFHYNLATFGKKFGTVDYASTANVAGCQKCHPTPYAKHAYILGTFAANATTGSDAFQDFLSCKVCHAENRDGHDQSWQYLVDDVAGYAANGGEVPDADLAKYAYKAKLMNDTHMSHAMEFAYPQSMANCVTCHEGKLDKILSDSFFKIETCKSCHAVTGKDLDSKRAPSLASLIQGDSPVAPIHTMDLYAYPTAAAPDKNCDSCHSVAGGIGRVFSKIHTGFDAQIYKSTSATDLNAIAKYSASIKASIDTATFDAATNKLTVNFTMSGLATGAIAKPTVVASLYGYDTKDFVVSGHVSVPADGKRSLEWAEGSPNPRLAVTPAVATAGNTSWTAVADLSAWSSQITSGQIKRLEFGVLPVVGLDQTKAVSATNVAIAVAGATKTFDLVSKALIADGSNGRGIIKAGACNECHGALGLTFHSPSYGSVDTVACRLCHAVTNAGGHLEQQSRSIDSYVHAIHSFQPFDVKDIDFTKPVAALRYEHHVESGYPMFTILNCESCHAAGTYQVPDQTKSLPSVISGSATNATFQSTDPTAAGYRTIGTVPSVIVGPGSRACGSCHRSQMINENDAAGLASFDSHTGTFSTQVAAGTSATTDAATGINSVFDQALKTIFSWFK